VDNTGFSPSSHGLKEQGLGGVGVAHWNLPAPVLVEQAIQRGEGRLSSSGSVVVTTGVHTGRSPRDKFIVKSTAVADEVDWGKINVAIDPGGFNQLHSDLVHYLQGREVYVQDLCGGWDEAYRLPVRIITTAAWQSLFARTLLVRPTAETLHNHVPQFTVIDVPAFKADPKKHGTRSETFILVNFEERLVLIGGTEYAGEIKKSVFTILNHLLPAQGVLPMHCSANIGPEGDTALFFGLSGTGKTTLSADPQRRLIGDDEHGWSDKGVFNFEGGCYAKCIKLSKSQEPQIWDALRFASVLENVVIDPNTRVPDFDNSSLTENTRAAYPLEYIDNIAWPSVGGHPRNVVFLTCDAFGVLPPIARLTRDQAMYHFLSGYTAKVAGTEKGVTEPEATFSTLFGAPFFTRSPMSYAEMLGQRLETHDAACWLVNTGWSGGPYGVGQRMNLAHTRAMIHAALVGTLNDVPYEVDSAFGLNVPKICPAVPEEILVPRSTWADTAAYDAKAKQLAGLFKQNFESFGGASSSIAAAGPR
jgi:phosphoenolpyruvate carboxykinase (ATP)